MPKIKPEFVPIYPVAESLDDAWLQMKSQLPITDTNDLKGLVMQYHNTLVSELGKEHESNIKPSSSTSN